MRKIAWMWCALFLVTAAGLTAAQRGPEGSAKPESFAGTWSGTWEGAGSSGGFDLTLEQAKDGPLTGKVSVTGEPTYKAVCKSLAFDGKKMTAKYVFTPDESAEVALTLSFDGTKATGAWSLHAKADGSEVVSGTLNLTRK